MSLPGLSRKFAVERADLAVAKLGVVVSVLLLGLQWFASQPFLLLIPLATGTGSALYVFTESTEGRAYRRPTLPRSVAGLLPAVVGLGLAGVVVATHVAGTRTDAVYLLTGGVGVAVFAQILFVDDDALGVGAVLCQILAAALVIRFGALYATPGYVGVDIWTHATVLVDGVARNGATAALGDSKYVMAPVYHVVGAIGTLVFGGVRDGIYLAVGLFVTLSALFVYATGRLVLPARWALLATALYGFSDQFIRWGMHVIPTSLGLAFFLAAAYLVTRLFEGDAERWTVALLAATSLAVVFTHQVSTVVLLFLLGAAALVAVALRAVGSNPNRVPSARTAAALSAVTVTTVAVTVVSWAYTPFSSGSRFLWRELAVLRTALTRDAGFLNLAGGDGGSAAAAGSQSAFAALIPYVELVGFTLLLAAAVVGGLLMLRWRASTGVSLTHVLTAGTMFVAVFGLSIFGVRVLMPGRWMAFLFVPMALLAAAGFSYVARTRSRRLVVAAFVVLALAYPTTMVVAEKATLDSPAFEDEHPRYAYTEPEIAAVGSTGAVLSPDSEQVVGTDHPYRTLYDRLGGYESGEPVLGANGPTATQVSVYRDYQSTGPISFETAADAPAVGAAAVSERVCPTDWDKRYANDAVWVCTQSGQPEAAS